MGGQEWKRGCPQETRGASQGEDGGGAAKEEARRRGHDPQTLRPVPSGDCPRERLVLLPHDRERHFPPPKRRVWAAWAPRYFPG